MEEVDEIKELIYRAENSGEDLELTKGNPYTRKAPDSSAVGKYQFVTSFWGDDIEKYAKENGYKYEGIDSFLNNHILQEEYTSNYVENTLLGRYIPQLKEDFDTSGIDDKTLASIVHFAGYGNVKKALETNDFTQSMYGGPSMNEYLRRAGLEPITPKERGKKITKEILTTNPSPLSNMPDNLRPNTGEPQILQDGGRIKLSLQQDINSQGYKDNSPYKNESNLLIESPTGKITMDNVSKPLMVESNTGQRTLLQPNSGVHQLEGTKFKETPVLQDGGRIRLSLTGKCLECDKEKFQDGGKKKVTSKKDFIYSQEELEAIQKDAANWHETSGKNCTGGVCLATDNIMPNIGQVGLSKWKEQNKYGSGDSHPDINNYGKSLDAWDIQGAIIKAGGVNYYNYNDKKEKPSQEAFDEMVKSFPVGTVLNYGNSEGKINPDFEKPYLNNEEGMLAGNHSTVIIGYDEQGYPLTYDYGEVKRLSQDSYGLLLNASAPKEYSQYTYDYLKDNELLDTSWESKPLSVDTSRLENNLTEDGETATFTFNKDSTNKFVNTLIENKEALASDIGISSNEEYDKLAKMATSLAMAETKGGSSSYGSVLDRLGGSSVGMTQINADIIFSKDKEGNYKDEKIVELLNKYGIQGKSDLFDENKSAIATMILLKTFKDRANISYNKGTGSGTSRYFRNADDLTGLIRGRDNVVIESTGETVNVPNSESGVEAFNKRNIKGYIAGKDEKGFFIKKDTKGNSELTEEEKIAYYWNSPYTLESGDAQGNSSYVKRIMDYYNKL